jgi:membrane protein DedA with SNARE-associated domain
MERRTPTFGELMRRLERAFEKASYPLVLILPNNPVCLLAGASRMPPVVFVVLNIVGTAGRLILLRIVGDAFQKPIDWLLSQISAYRLPLTVFSIVIVGFVAFSEWRKGTGELEQLLELEEDLEEELEEELGEGS